MIAKFPEFDSQEAHHAIIIAHKKPANREFPNDDYESGVDILIKRFQSDHCKIRYKIYEGDSKEQIIPVICDKNTTHLWIFGHGQRNRIHLKKGNLCYFDVRNAPKKVFIGQYHCNSYYGHSLADYNHPIEQDVTRWLRIGPFIRLAVLKKIRELESKNLLNQKCNSC